MPQHIILACDKGALPSELISFSHKETTVLGENMCTKVDKVVNVNFKPFGPCACKNGNPCFPAVTDWTNLSDFISVGPNELLLEDSELPCTLGGTIKIFYSMQAAGAYLPEQEEEEDEGFWGTAWSFTKGLGKGLWKGAKGTVLGAVDLVVWSAKHSPAYMLYDWEGYQEQIAKDVEMAKAIGNAVVKAGTWAYRSSDINRMLDPEDWAKQQADNIEAFDNLMKKASEMDAEEWGDFAGQVLFEVALEVGTAGLASAATVAKVADKGIDAARALNALDNIADTGRALENAEDVLDAGKALDKIEDGASLPPVPEELGDVVNNGAKLDNVDPPGTFRDSNGKLRNDDGTFATDPNTVKFNRSMSERRKALIRDAKDPNSGLSDRARKRILDSNGKNVPNGYEVSHEIPLYTGKTLKEKKALDRASNMKTQQKHKHRKRHQKCGDQYHDFPL